VIHVFKKNIREKKKVGITDLNMTRFFLTVEDAIKLVFKAAFESVGGEIFVMKMPACKIIDLANVLIKATTKEKVEIEILGVRPGEKIHELLLTTHESNTTIVFGEEYYVILPSVNMNGIKHYYSGYKKIDLEDYNSSTNLLTEEEIQEMLEKGGFI
jgi:FlaA1/EpsC-like NDP-sugar epimerase